MVEFATSMEITFEQFIADAKKAFDDLQAHNSTETLVPHWYVDVLLRLFQTLHKDFMRVFEAYDKRDLVVLSYTARNLLELDVWAMYCLQSVENAEQFRHDSIRDFAGVKEAATAIFADLPSLTIPADAATNLIKLDKKIKASAAANGIPNINADYKRTAAAAKKVGMLPLYTSVNTLLSKQAHPTALRVFTDTTVEQNDGFCYRTIELGVIFGHQAMTALMNKCLELVKSI